MRFYDREEEIKVLEKFCRIAIIGRRRVGKTRLVEETFRDKCLTLFIPAEKSEALICRDWLKTVREKGIYIPEVLNMKDIVEYILKTQPSYVLFLDELQNVLKVNKSFLYDLQRLLDIYRERRTIVSGSMISMSKKITEKYRSPLYGRFDLVLKLKELSFPIVAEICRDLGYGLEDAIVAYSVFGGIPKYYETLEKVKLDINSFIEMMFFKDPYPLVEDVRLMLREEFGKEYKIYFSILEAISESKNTYGEIGGYVGLQANKLSKYMYNLEREFEMITRISTIIGRSKRIYRLTSNLINFWFKFVWKLYPKIFSTDEALRNFKLNFNSYVGRKFEEISAELIKRLNLGFNVTKHGRIWGKAKNGEVFEIDLAALNDEIKKIVFFEVKWSEQLEEECYKILEALENKVKLIQECRTSWRKYFGIIAKKIENKEKLRGRGYIVFDLEDFKNLLLHN